MKDKVVLITGGTSGIGEAAALKFGEAGAKVVVSGRREAEGAKVVDAVKAAGGEATFVKADIANEDEVKNLVGKTVEIYGGLDVAFNNAGVEIAGPITEVSREDYQRIFDINVWGVVTSMKYEIPMMLERGGGSII
ncbi:MAG: SDR family NAD(P)-dependent oxidoreductase, partial [Verrucomicrobiota bacterium]